MPGHDRVVYAGMPESETEAERLENGVPLHPEVIDWFRGICGEFEIPFDSGVTRAPGRCHIRRQTSPKRG